MTIYDISYIIGDKAYFGEVEIDDKLLFADDDVEDMVENAMSEKYGFDAHLSSWEAEEQS